MRVIKSMILGLAIGTIMGIVMFPELDRRTQRNIKRAKKRAMCMANDTYYGLYEMSFKTIFIIIKKLL